MYNLNYLSAPENAKIQHSTLYSQSQATHSSNFGKGGYMEVPTLLDLYNIPTSAANVMDSSGLSSGRRKLGMIVYVLENKRYYQLKPKFKDTKKEIPFHLFATLPNLFKLVLMNPGLDHVGSPGFAIFSWDNLESTYSSDVFNSLKKYACNGLLFDTDGDGVVNLNDFDNDGKLDTYIPGVVVGKGGGLYSPEALPEIEPGVPDITYGVTIEPFDGVPAHPFDAWAEVFIKGWEDSSSQFSPAIFEPFSPKRPVYFVADNNTSAPAHESDLNVLSKDFDLSDGSVFGIQVGTNTKRIVIAYPSAYGDLTRVIDSSTGFNIIGSFNKTTVLKYPPLSTDFTPPNTDYDGLANIPYNVYTSILAISYSSPTVYTVTI
jgi:hypothetical protein